MSKRFDLSKIFPDPATFGVDGNIPMVEDEFMTELIVSDLPHDFSVQRALDELATSIATHYPDMPDCAWAGHTTDDNIPCFIMAFEKPVEIAYVTSCIAETIQNEIQRCVNASNAKPFKMAYDTLGRYQDLLDFVNSQESNNPRPPAP